MAFRYAQCPAGLVPSVQEIITCYVLIILSRRRDNTITMEGEARVILVALAESNDQYPIKENNNTDGTPQPPFLIFR